MILRALSLALVLTAMAAPAPAQQAELTVQRIWGTGDFSGDLEAVQWSRRPGAYTTVDVTGDGRTDLYAVDAASGERELLVRGQDLLAPGGSDPIRIEEYEFSADGRRLLIFTNSVRVWRQNTRGTYYVWDFDARRLIPVSTEPGYQMFAKFSPDARLVGFVREHDLFVSNIETGEEARITHDGSDDIINGTTDWVYEEELGLRDAFRISPDGRSIAFWRLDQSAIRPFYLLNELELYPELQAVRYPKAGEANSTVRIGLATIGTDGPHRWIDIGTNPDIYIAQMGFAGASDEVWLTRLNRHQNRLELLLADVATGASRVVLTETDAAWVDATTPHWIRDGREFLWESERDGANHVYRYRRDGTLLGKVTDVPWEVTAVHGVDEARGVVYVSGTGEGALERHLYRVGLDGRNLRRLTSEPGWHSVSFDADHGRYVDTWSAAGVPPVRRLHRADGRLMRVISDNAALRGRIDSLGLRLPEFTTVRAADGTTELNAWLIRPPDFDPSRAYPLLLYVYGGPGSQTVRDGWDGQRYLWHQLLARQGYVVASVDNRGTGGRGRDFRKQTYRRLGQLESADQIAAARQLGAEPWIDADRVAIWGWSYGGYMSSLSLLRGNDVFAAAIAVAPVTSWRLYDTIYTERYMRTPQENPDGYEQGAPLTWADRLTGDLLLVHGTGDDNVHPQNTIQLVDRLEAANRQFDLRIYPNRTHSIAGGVTRVNLYGLLTEWLARRVSSER